MSKHTPGPWHVVPLTLGSVEAENGTAVCQAFMTKQPRKAEDHEERLANARLIAAAPELLEALKDYLQAGEDCCNPEKDGVVAMVLFAKAEEAARAAIAKAEAA